MPYATANGIRIYYETEGSGEPLVLVTGYSSDVSHWITVRDELSRHFQIVMVDNRGAGRTDPPVGPFSMQDMADDVLGLCESLQLQKPHLLGHSMGGAIVQSIAYRHPKRIGKVILSQTFCKFRELGRAIIRASLHLAEYEIPARYQYEMIFPWLFSEDFYHDSRKLEMFLERKVSYPYRTPIEVMHKHFAAMCDFDSSSWYHKIAAETLVLGGEQDLLCPLEDNVFLCKGIKGAKLHVFPRMGHMASLEIPKEHNRVVCEFLT
jgi:3-oxoadipate enol-lactonase